MASKPLVLTDPNLLAEFVRESEFKAFLEKRFATPPDLAALLFRNGELIDSYKGAHFSVGGLATALKSTIGGSTHIALMLADLKPFPVELPVKAMSKDQIEIVGLATLELQLDPDKPSNILGLMSGVSRNEVKAKKGEMAGGRRALSRIDVLERIAPHFADRVFEAVIGRMNAVDIRGETGLQDKLQADMMLEAERICGDIGVVLRAASVQWAMNEAEREAFARAQIDRQQDALDYQLELLKRQVERQQDATEVKLNANVDIIKLENASEDELEHMALNSELNLIDARETGVRQLEMKALAYEIETLRNERAARMENDIAEAGHTIDLTKERARLRIVEREIDILDAEHVSELKKIHAFTDIELEERTARMKLDITAAEQKLARGNLEGLQDIQHKGLDKDAEREMMRDDAKAKNEIELLNAKAEATAALAKTMQNMSPEQMLAINAGFSPDVAAVLMEQARAGGGDTMKAMQELMRGAAEERAISREHELNILKAGMAGASGVAHGAGGKSGGPDLSGASDQAHIDCPKCGKTLPAKANFCTGCGHQLRT